VKNQIKTEKRPRKFYWHPDAVALSGLSLATLLFFWPLLLGGDWHIPKGGGDLESFLWPTYRYAAHTLRSGEIPLWNPYLHSGAPYAADNQSGLFYPPNLLLALLPDVPYRAMEWLVALHTLFAGCGMYIAARHHYPRANIQPPLVAALAFQFSSVFVTHIGNLNIVATSAFLPWAWLFMHRMQNRRSLASAATLAATLGLAVLAGHAQMALILSLAISLTALWILATQPRKAQWIGLCAITAVLTLGLCAFSIIPTVELAQYTHRAELIYAQAARYSLPPIGMTGMFSPLVFGRGPEHFWPTWERVELGFAGIVTLLLVPLGLRQNSSRGILLILAIVGILVALGPATPTHALLFSYLPSFSQLRAPARFLLLTNFAWAMLACSGLHHWQKNIIPKHHLLALTGGMAAITAFVLPLGWYMVANQYPGTAPQTLPLALTVALTTLAAALILGPRWVTILLAFELIGLGAWVEVQRTNPDEGFRSGPAVELLRTQPIPFRIDVAASSWQPNSPAIHRLESISGLYNPLTLARYDTYYWSVGHRGSAQYNFLNAKYLIADKGKPAADSSFIPIFDSDPHVDVYLNTNAQPRITLVYDTIIVENENEAFAAIHESEFDPTTHVVLQSGIPLFTDSVPSKGGLRYSYYSAQKQTVEVVTTSPAYLVISELWYPGWQAKLDAQPIAILRANFAFRAVYIPPGEHTVEISFVPSSWRYAPLASLSTILLLIVIYITKIRHMHKSHNE